jgi:hypothetical protein
VALVEWGARLDRDQSRQLFRNVGIVAAAGIAAAMLGLAGTSLEQRKASDLQDDWHNELSLAAAAWLKESVAPGSNVMSSRLYYSHLYFLSGGEFSVHQLPTVEVDLALAPGDPLALERRSTLFRWEQHLMPADSPDDRWLYLTRYPIKGYFVGLAEDDLLAELRRREIDYVVLSSRDAGFSSPSFVQYFEDNAAFERVFQLTAASGDEVRVYRVHAERLAPQAKPAQVTAAAYEYVSRRLGAAGADAYFYGLNPAGFRVVPH